MVKSTRFINQTTREIMDARNAILNTPTRKAIEQRPKIHREFGIKRIINGDLKSAYGKSPDLDWIISLKEEKDKKYHYVTNGDLMQLLIGRAYQVVMSKEISFREHPGIDIERFSVVSKYGKIGYAISIREISSAPKNLLELVSKLYAHEAMLLKHPEEDK